MNDSLAQATPEQAFIRMNAKDFAKSSEHWEENLTIDLSLDEIKDTYRDYGVLQLRRLKHSKLIIGCGTKNTTGLCRKSHQDADTIDRYAPSSNPSVVGVFAFNGEGSNALNGDPGLPPFFENEKYEQIVSEADSAFYGLSEIARILKPGGLYLTSGVVPDAYSSLMPANMKLIRIAFGLTCTETSPGQFCGVYDPNDKKYYGWRDFDGSETLKVSTSAPYQFIFAKELEGGDFPTAVEPEFENQLMGN